MAQAKPVFLSDERKAAYMQRSEELGRAVVQSGSTWSGCTSVWFAEQITAYSQTYAQDVSKAQPRHKKRSDLASTGASSVASTILPFSGLLVSVPYVLWICIDYIQELGLVGRISREDVTARFTARFNERHSAASGSATPGATGAGSTKPTKQAAMTAAEGAMIDVLKAVAGEWVESLAKELITFVALEVGAEAAGIVPGTGLIFWPIKYGLQRHQIKHFRKSMDKKAQERHRLWVDQNMGQLLAKAQAATTSAAKHAA